MCFIRRWANIGDSQHHPCARPLQKQSPSAGARPCRGLASTSCVSSACTRTRWPLHKHDDDRGTHGAERSDANRRRRPRAWPTSAWRPLGRHDACTRQDASARALHGCTCDDDDDDANTPRSFDLDDDDDDDRTKHDDEHNVESSEQRRKRTRRPPTHGTNPGPAQRCRARTFRR